MTGALPEPVRLAAERAERAGFTMSCDPGTGRLLTVLAAAVPANGRVTVEIDAATAALAAQYSWPSWVRLLTGDAMEVTRTAGRFDLIFADAQDVGGERGQLGVTC